MEHWPERGSWKSKYLNYIWVKVFKNGPSKICGKQPLKSLIRFFKGCVPQSLLGPFLNTFTNIMLTQLFTKFIAYKAPIRSSDHLISVYTSSIERCTNVHIMSWKSCERFIKVHFRAYISLGIFCKTLIGNANEDFFTSSCYWAGLI